MLREGGATHVEPGCGVMGSTPPQMVESDHVEIPAYTFVTEISHHYEDAAYGIANGGLWTMLGGFTPADWPIGAMVGNDARGGAGEPDGLPPPRPDHRLPHPAAAA